MNTRNLPKSVLLRAAIKYLLLLSILLVFSASPSFSQQNKSVSSVQGTIKNSQGELLVGATVGISSLKKYSLTDSEGNFTLEAIPFGNYELSVTYIGHKEVVRKIDVTSLQTKLPNIVMEDNASQLQEIEVVGKSETALAKEQPFKAEVINTRALAVQPANMVDVMNRSVGVRIRQMGGLGSYAGVMLNGFQDRGIRYFKDQIPMDYLGQGYNFALVPVNMLERIEIYKGVLPTSLGADALGGAINMVSKKSYSKYLQASYELASFNTHRGSINAYHKDTARHYFVGADVFINHSDNDYTVTAAVTDPDLATQTMQKVKLFHNKFDHYFTEVYGGVTRTRWADELRVGLTGYYLDRDNQYGSRMSQPFGKSTYSEYSVVPTLRYEKALLNGKLTIDQFLEANTIHREQIDTAKGIYNWKGEFIPSTSRRGEITLRGSLAKTNVSYVTSRSYLTYLLSATHKLEFNAVYQTVARKGSDPLGLTFIGSGRDLLSVPAYYDKTVFGLGLLSKFADDRLVNNVIVKYYASTMQALEADFYGKEIDRNTSTKRWGVAEAVKFTFNKNSFMRLSAELATRLPEQDEIFGDGNLHVANFELKPERSTNFNLGYRTSKTKYALELNGFYRITHDRILNVPYNFLFNQNQNIENVKGIGLETDLTVNVLSWLKANGNFTYQDIRLFKTGNSAKEGARIRNTPYFFANLGLSAAKRHLIHSKDNFQAYWYFTFVREYYLDNIPKDREPDGFLGLWGKAKFDAPNIIPNQTLHTAGITYFPYDNKLSIGLQARNVFDANIYDNFRIQNAGRSFHLKITYTIN